jgi:hypothetical protein
MIEGEPKCDYCSEKAVETVHSFADKEELQQTTTFVKNMIKSITLSGELMHHKRVRGLKFSYQFFNIQSVMCI